MLHKASWEHQLSITFLTIQALSVYTLPTAQLETASVDAPVSLYLTFNHLAHTPQQVSWDTTANQGISIGIWT